MTVGELVRELTLAPQDAEIQIHGLTLAFHRTTVLDIKHYAVDRVELPTPRTLRIVAVRST
jgi:hypothetical protein